MWDHKTTVPYMPKKASIWVKYFCRTVCKCDFNIFSVPAQNGRWTKYNTDLFKRYLDFISCLDPHHKVVSFQKNIAF